jgi:hypothetical protein
VLKLATTTTTTTTTTTSTTTTATTTTKNATTSPCLEGSYNHAQFALGMLAFVALLISTLLLHYSFFGSLVETLVMVFVVLVAAFAEITALVFWINTGRN